MPSRLVLPLPPSQNHSHVQINRGGRLMRIPSARAKAFAEEAAWTAAAWAKAARWQVPDRERKIVLRYWTYWPDRRRRDPSNLPKILLDALTGTLWHDDCTVLPQAMDYAVDRESPRLEIELEVAT